MKVHIIVKGIKLVRPLANAGTVGASLILVDSLFKSHIPCGKNEFMWCFVF